LGHSFLQVALRDKEEDMQPTEFEQLLTETLAARGRSPRTQETYTLMLRLFGRHLNDRCTGKTLEGVGPPPRRGCG
jgi:hypothetical protein